MKRLLCLFLAVCVILALPACGTRLDTDAQEVPLLPTENVPPEPDEYQVLDGAGRIVNLPSIPESATIASVYAVSVPFIVALGLSDRTVAVNPKTKFWTNADTALSKQSIGRGVVDLEKLATYSPTVLIHRSNDPETVATVENLGVSVLCITVEDIEDIETTLNMMGKFFGVGQRAEEVILWLRGKFDKVAKIVETIPDSERKSALLMGGELGRVAGNDMLQTWMIQQAGGIPVADEGKDHNWINVGVEKVFQWNPDYIFCTSSTGLDYNENDILQDPAWSAVEAVKSGNVFTIPAKIDSWDIPGLSCILGTMYMLRAMYPSYFSIEDFHAEIDDYYTFMFGKTFDADTLGYSLD